VCRRRKGFCVPGIGYYLMSIYCQALVFYVAPTFILAEFWQTFRIDRWNYICVNPITGYILVARNMRTMLTLV
jgi:hypothetical protein